jgi:hypothetical protein
MTTTDLSYDEIGERATQIYTRAQDRLGWSGMLDTPEDRAALTGAMDPAERAELLSLDAAAGRKLKRLGEDALAVEHRQRSQQIAQAMDEAAGRQPRRSGHSPLLVSEVHLRSHAEAIRTGATYGAEESLEIETRANVAVTDMGSPGSWGAPGVREPLTLRRFAGIPVSPLTGSTAQLASLTLPAGAAGAAEGAAHGEYDSVDPVNLSTLRYGRWTQVTSFVSVFDDLTSINQAHAIGIARDLTLADATTIQTAAGAAVAFSATLLDQNIREAVLKVAAAVLCDPGDVVLFGRSASLAPIVGYSPASGEDRGSVSIRIDGARVFTHEAATVKIVTAFAPVAFRVFADRLRSGAVIDPTNGMNKFGQWLHSTPAGVSVVGGAAAVQTLV